MSVAAPTTMTRMPNVAPTSRVMLVAVMVSMVAFLDTTVVNVALPATERDLGGGMCLQQWIVDGYLLAVAAMILPGGSISDVLGRIPVLRFGLVAFGIGSALSAMATLPAMLIGGRIIQGLGGAFLVPGSLALINSAFERADRSAAIGTWTAWTGTAFAAGPLLGGLAVDFLSWRWIYVLSAIPMVIGFAVTFWLPPVPRSAERARVDVPGALLSAVGLSAIVYALIESQKLGWSEPLVGASMVVGVAALVGFVVWQRRAPHPLVPRDLFAIRNFAGANVVTALVYGGLALGSLAIALYIQEVAGYSATAAGLITLPSPVMSFLFARRIGTIAARIGPRVFLIAGPVLAAAGLLLICPVYDGFNVWTHLIPGMMVLATGMVITITPLTSLNLSSVEPERSGIAAAIQNAVGRTSALTTVACVALISAGTVSDMSFARILQVSAALFVIGAVVSAVMIRNNATTTRTVVGEVGASRRLEPQAV